MIPRLRDAGETLYVEGSPATRVWWVKSGTVALTRDVGDAHGSGIAWALRRPGSILGVESLVRPEYEDSARTLSSAVVCAVSSGDFSDWLGPSGTPARAVLEATLTTTVDDGGNNTEGRSDIRVARWLLDEAIGGRAPSIPRAVMANLLGMRPETLSRVLARLAERGAIEVSRTTIRVLDADLLVAVELSPPPSRPARTS